MREALDAKGTGYLYLDGRTPAAERDRLVERFQAGEGGLFLISLKAGGTGLNLTGADYVIHLDPWWNPAVEDQATDRAHRIGQTRPVTVYRTDATLKSYPRSARRFFEFVAAEGARKAVEADFDGTVSRYLEALRSGRFPAPTSERKLARSALRRLGEFLAGDGSGTSRAATLSSSSEGRGARPLGESWTAVVVGPNSGSGKAC